MSDTISAQLYLKFAKDIEPEIFENKTPKFHIDLINFINSPSQYKAAAVFRGASKTTLLNKICVVSRIFFHAEPFTMIASSNDAKATGFLDAVSDAINNAIDKGYALAKGSVWNKNMIEGVVNKGLKDASGKSIERLCHVVSVSAGQDPRGANIKNKRPTLLIVDDLESNVGQYAVASRSNRQKLRKWFYADLLPALHPTKGKLVIIGTIIHDDSILNNIINRKSDEDTADIEWDIVKIPIIKDGVSAWPSRFPIQKIEKIKSTLEAAGLNNEFYQEYMCAAINPQKAIFKREYFRYFKAVKYDYKKPFTTLV